MKILAIGDFHGKFPKKLQKIAKSKDIDLILCTGDFTGIEEWRPLLKKMYKINKKKETREISIKDMLGEKKYNQLLKKDYLAGKIILQKLNKFNKKVISVFGNGDWYKSFFNDVNKYYEDEIKKLRNLKDINRSNTKFKGLTITGFGGYLDSDIYFKNKGRIINDTLKQNKKRKKHYKQEEKKLMNLMKKSKPNILLTHYNPYNCLDKLKFPMGFLKPGSKLGISSYNKAIKKYSPSLVICGHMHENQGKCTFGRTIVINPGAAIEGKATIINFDEKIKKVVNVKFIK